MFALFLNTILILKHLTQYSQYTKGEKKLYKSQQNTFELLSLYNVLRKLRALEMETFEITLSNVNLYKIVS